MQKCQSIDNVDACEKFCYEESDVNGYTYTGKQCCCLKFDQDKPKNSHAAYESEKSRIEDDKAATRAVTIFGSWLIGITIFFIVWGVIGFAGFIFSIICFWKSGTTGQHILGLILSILLGPFYWIYYAAVKSYCR